MFEQLGYSLNNCGWNVESQGSSEDQFLFLESWCILDNQYFGISLKMPTPTPAADHPLRDTREHGGREWSGRYPCRFSWDSFRLIST